jgi:hypothetical protein
MNLAGDVLAANLRAAWALVVLGILSGAILGLGFAGESWLGGYAGFRRRLYRLGHISFFGLALLNLMFYFTAREASVDGGGLVWASRLFILGGVTMPVCCAVLAHFPRGQALFAVPVGSLLVAGVLTMRLVWVA